MYQSIVVATAFSALSVLALPSRKHVLPNARSGLFKRDSWGPAVGIGPSTQPIISAQSTIYPGLMPKGQIGGLWVWTGMSNGTDGGDLIQSIVGSYSAGNSECYGDLTDRNNNWCISSEVYGLNSAGVYNQFVGDFRSIDYTPSNGLVFNYTLIDSANYTWLQQVYDATTGTPMANYTHNSGPMLGWGTAVECDGYPGDCTHTIDTQIWANTKIVLAAADPAFSSTLGASSHAYHTPMTSTDDGITWTIDEILIPPMNLFTPTPSNSSTCNAADTCNIAVVKQDVQAAGVRMFCNRLIYAANPPSPAAHIADACGSDTTRIEEACNCLPIIRPITCPTSDGAIYYTPSGSRWQIECHTARAGNDLQMVEIASGLFTDCIVECESTSGCVDLTMIGNKCYLKNGVGTATNVANRWGARFLS